MEPDEMKDQPHVPVLVVIGAGPKAAAIAVKAKVLKDLKGKDIKLIVVERHGVAANWKGGAGFTDGEGPLGTTPEKDLGYPYESIYGHAVDKAMLMYSWQAYQLTKTAYAGWVDRGRLHPQQKVWTKYLEWAITTTLPKDSLIFGEAKKIVPENGKLMVHVEIRDGNDTRTEIIKADGVVLTGPGESILIDDMPSNSEYICDGRNYWQRIDKFRGMKGGKVALIGGGETAASIALSLLHANQELKIEIINRHGTIYTRGESYREIKVFSDPEEWGKLGWPAREEFIKRTDRGVFSVAAQREIDKAENINTIMGYVERLREERSKIVAHLVQGGKSNTEIYDMAIVALGFDPWSALELFPQQFQPRITSEEKKDIQKRLKEKSPKEVRAVINRELQKTLQRDVDKHLRVSFDSVRALAKAKINVHMPMVAGLAQGPGFPNLLCLGHMADRILSLYIPASDAG